MCMFKGPSTSRVRHIQCLVALRAPVDSSKRRVHPPAGLQPSHQIGCPISQAPARGIHAHMWDELQPDCRNMHASIAQHQPPSLLTNDGCLQFAKQTANSGQAAIHPAQICMAKSRHQTGTRQPSSPSIKSKEVQPQGLFFSATHCRTWRELHPASTCARALQPSGLMLLLARASTARPGS